MNLPQWQIDILKDELNVKEVKYGDSLKLDLTITPDLQEECIAREIIHTIQRLRKEKGVKLTDKINISIYFRGSNL